MNSLYGILGNKNFLYYKVENAEAITLTGQLVNKWNSNRVEASLNKMFDSDERLHIFGDTDSCGFTVNHFMNQLPKKMNFQKKIDCADKFAKEVIQPMFQEYGDELKDYLNNPENKMVWEREIISDKCFFVAKKCYAMSVWDNEGIRYTKEPKLKIKGLASERTTTPEWSREDLKKCYRYILDENKDDFYDFVENVEDDFYKRDINDMALPTGVKNVQKYEGDNRTFKSKCPQHVKGAINHNWLIEDKKIKHINMIKSGDKIKYLYLDKTNPTGVEIIGFDSYLPKEFELDNYIDKKRTFYKAFTSHLEKATHAVDWSIDRTVSLESFL